MSIGPLTPLWRKIPGNYLFYKETQCPAAFISLSMLWENGWQKSLGHVEEACSLCLWIMEILLLEGITAESVMGLFELEPTLAEKWSKYSVWLSLDKQSKWEMLLLNMRKLTFTHRTFMGGWNSIVWAAAARGFPRHLCSLFLLSFLVHKERIINDRYCIFCCFSYALKS